MTQAALGVGDAERGGAGVISVGDRQAMLMDNIPMIG
jgi:hypothetical protein